MSDTPPSRIVNTRTFKRELAKATLNFHRAGTRLVKMHSGRGVEWFLLPGGHVSADIAAALIAQPNVEAGADSLFPNHDQTWRVSTSSTAAA